MTDLAPLRLAPLDLVKAWGSERWVVADLLATSASGAGGGAQQTRIVGGALDGATLREAMAAWGPALMGTAAPSPDGGFPLLVKFLDAREHLSVQVHPTPAYAAGHAGVAVKHECWYVLAHEPGARLFLGLRAGAPTAALADRAVSGAIAGDLETVPAEPGDCHLLPSGLIHALGAGTRVYEVQTPSDTTFRLYDWTHEYRRAPRALHRAESLEACDVAARPVSRRLAFGADDGVVAEGPAFELREARFAAGRVVPVARDASAPVVVTALDRPARLAGDGLEAPWPLGPEETVVVPAALARALRVEGQGRVLLSRPTATAAGD